jgi:hypothetical protein
MISEIKSPEMSIIPAENTSVIASKSETTLVTIAPTGFLSKYFIRKERRCLNILTRKSRMTDCAKRFEK